MLEGPAHSPDCVLPAHEEASTQLPTLPSSSWHLGAETTRGGDTTSGTPPLLRCSRYSVTRNSRPEKDTCSAEGEDVPDPGYTMYSTLDETPPDTGELGMPS
jgi:hypothetical protein